MLTETVTSPTLAAQIEAIRGVLPGAEWHVWDPVSRDNCRAGVKLAIGAGTGGADGGRELAPLYRFDKARVILSLDSNFLLDEPGSLRYAREFVRSRGVDGVKRPERSEQMSRMYAVESTPTITGTVADHRLRLTPAGVEAVARRIAAAVAGSAAPAGPVPGVEAGEHEKVNAFVRAVAADLTANRGRAIVVAGEWQPPEMHALAYAMTAALGGVGGTDKPLSFIRAAEARPVNGVESLRSLLADMDAGRVDLLLILGGNPAYTAPADLAFGDRLKAFTERTGSAGERGWSVHLSLYEDETSARCQWHVPEVHYLEEWGDVRADDGTASIVQPLIAPLYGGHGVHDLLGAVLERAQAAGASNRAAAGPAAPTSASTSGPTTSPSSTGAPALALNSGYEIVRDYWRRQAGENGFEAFWHKALTAGIVPATAFAVEDVAIKTDLAALASAAPVIKPAGKGSVAVVFRPDPSIWDGRFANNAWLQELPKPLTKLVWDNAVLMSPATAAKLGLLTTTLNRTGDSDKLHQINGRLVSLTTGGVTLDKVPVWLTPGHPDGSVTVHLGYGRESAGSVGNGLGFNAYLLRTSGALWHTPAEMKVCATAGR